MAVKDTQFPEAKIDVKAMTPEIKEQQTQNVVKSVKAASPSERRAGMRWYQDAHRQVVHLAAGVPAHQQQFEPGSAPKSERRIPGTGRGLEALRGALSGGGIHDANRPSPEAMGRESGSVAALSPAMDWEKNIQAAQEIHGLSAHEVGTMRDSVRDMRAAQGAERAARAAAKTHGEGSPEHSAAMEASQTAQATYQASKAAARAPLQGKALNNQSTDNIIKAHDIHTGAKTPEEALPMGIKTGNFHRNILDPKNREGVTIDTRSADIAMGTTYPWKTDRGLSSQARYDHFADVHRQARDVLNAPTTHGVQAVSWLQNKNAMLSGSRGKHRHGESIHGDGANL